MADNSDKHAASGVKEVAGKHVWLMNKAANVLEVLTEFVKKL